MVVVILVNFNNVSDTIDCITSVIASNYSNYKIVVVDNCSTDNSYEILCKEIPLIAKTSVCYNLYSLSIEDIDSSIFIVKSVINGGFAAGNNIGVEFIRTNSIEVDYFWFLNNDTIIEKDTLSVLVARMDLENKLSNRVGILGCKLFRYYQPDNFQGVGGLYNKYTATCKQLGDGEFDKGQYDVLYLNNDYPIGASLFVSNSFINTVGLMQEDYFLYFEEMDWVLRGQKKGFVFGYEYRAKVYHKEGGSTKSNIKRLGKVADHCQVRNRILFTSRFYPKYLLSVILMTFGSVVNRILRGQFVRAVELMGVIFRTSFDVIFKLNA